LNKIYGRTYLQKIFFLIENELFTDLDFNYIKYNYGPFSKDLHLSVNELIKKGLVEERTIYSGEHETHLFELTKKGKIYADQISQQNKNKYKKIDKFCDKFRNHSPSELLRYVYSNYPSWGFALKPFLHEKGFGSF
jgi:uncharacterized protein YwgA